MKNDTSCGTNSHGVWSRLKRNIWNGFFVVRGEERDRVYDDEHMIV